MTLSIPRLGVALVVLAALESGCTGAESRKASFVAQGQQHMAAHDWQKARLDFRNALQIDPKDQGVQLLAAQAAERAGEYAEAASRYRALMEQEGSDTAARAALARLYAAGGLGVEALKLAEDGLTTHPKDAGLLAVRGLARMSRGDKQGAQEDATAAIAQAPANPDAATLLASLLAEQGRGDEAL
jgi:Tfp pilus assembly protein PilF